MIRGIAVLTKREAGDCGVRNAEYGVESGACGVGGESAYSAFRVPHSAFRIPLRLAPLDTLGWLRQNRASLVQVTTD